MTSSKESDDIILKPNQEIQLELLHKSAMDMPHRSSRERNQSKTLNLALYLLDEGPSLRDVILVISQEYRHRSNQQISDELRTRTLTSLYALFNTSLGKVGAEDFLFLAPVSARSLIHGGLVDEKIRQEVIGRAHDRYLNGAQNHTPENTLTIGRFDPETLLIREVGTRSFPIEVNGEQRLGEINEYTTYALTTDGISRLGMVRADPHYHNYDTCHNGEVVERRLELEYDELDIAQIFQNEPRLPTEVSDQELSILLHHAVHNIVDPQMQLKSPQLY